MKVALACGGTGGHIFPGLATAEVLRARGHEVVLWMAGKDVESTAVEGWTGKTITVPAQGFPSGVSWKALGVAWRLLLTAQACKRLMRADKPDVLLAMGSYASVGPVSAALRLRVPVVLHEANVIPGRAVRLFARRATTLAVSFEETRYYARRKNLVVTGMPLRKSLETGADDPALDRNLFTLLVMGGSRGAKRVNEVGSDAVCALQARGLALQVIHLCGAGYESQLEEKYTRANVPHVVRPFAQDMGSVYRASDLAVCRSGASSCSELLSFGVPSLLIPYPYAARDHQMANARALEKAGASDVVPESDLTVEWLADYVARYIEEPGRLARMSAAATKRALPNGARALADAVEQAASAKGAR